jgi:hypothetical protein
MIVRNTRAGRENSGRYRIRYTCLSIGEVVARGVLWRSAAMLIAAALLSACVATDRFHGRAEALNAEFAQTRQKMVLQNVVRAAYTLPLQFTEISTVSGQATAEATLSSSLPIVARRPIGTSAGLLTSTLSPSLRMSGNATFNVGNLSTQKFYNGIQTPVSKQLIALYLRSSFPARVLLPLVISEIELVHKGRRIRLSNDPDRPSAYKNFNSALGVLIRRGLNVRQVSPSTTLGPVLSEDEAAHPLIQSQIIAAGGGAARLKKVDGGYQLTRSSGDFAFCFDPLVLFNKSPYSESGIAVAPLVVDKYPAIPLVTADRVPYGPAFFHVDETNLCGGTKIRPGADADGARQVAGLDFVVTTRSVEEVFNYLGAIVRTEHGLGGKPPHSLLLRWGDGSEYKLFHLSGSVGAASSLSVAEQGARYDMKIDPSGADQSARVLQFLTDLVALQSSADALPSPTIISVFNQ